MGLAIGHLLLLFPIVSSCISFSALPPGLSVGVAFFFYFFIILLLSAILGTVYVETVQSSHRLGWSTQASEDADASCSALCFHCRRLDHVQSFEGDKSHNFLASWRLVHACRFVDRWAWIARGVTNFCRASELP